jgi:hypothetical protein
MGSFIENIARRASVGFIDKIVFTDTKYAFRFLQGIPDLIVKLSAN